MVWFTDRSLQLQWSLFLFLTSAALLGAFLNRFSIGFVLGAVSLPWPGWASGLVFGVLLSLADAVITKAYAPIIILALLAEQ